MIQSLKIVFVYENEFIPEKGGIRRVTDVLTQEFLKRGHVVYYLVFRKTEDGLQYKFPAKTYYFPDGNIDSESNNCFINNFLKEKHIDILIYQNNLMSNILLPLNEYSSNPKTLFINVIHTTPTLGLEYLRKSYFTINKIDVKSVLRFLWHILNYPSYKAKRKKSLWRRLKYDIENSDNTVLLSKSYTSILVKKYNVSDIAKLTVIPNPLCLPSNTIVEKNKKNTLLYVGRLENEVKQTHLIIKVWNKLAPQFPNWTLKIVGDGPSRRLLESKCRYKNQTIFLGFTNPEKYYSEAKILLMTSLFEGWPLVIPEAMNSGVVPILFNSFESATEIISDSINGVLVNPFDLEEYMKKLESLMSNEEKLKILSKNAFESSQKFLVKEIGDRWEDLFNEGELAKCH